MSRRMCCFVNASLVPSPNIHVKKEVKETNKLENNVASNNHFIAAVSQNCLVIRLFLSIFLRQNTAYAQYEKLFRKRLSFVQRTRNRRIMGFNQQTSIDLFFNFFSLLSYDNYTGGNDDDDESSFSDDHLKCPKWFVIVVK